MKKIVELVSQFEDYSLPVEEWTHLNKIRVCCYYLLMESDPYEVIVMLRCGIIKYRATKTTENRCLKGYNETATVFWVHMCKNFLTENGLLPTFGIERLHESTFKNYALLQDEFFEKVYKSIDNGSYLKDYKKFKLDSSYIYEFFSKEYLETSQARAMYVPPKKIIK